MYSQPIEHHNGDSTSQTAKMIDPPTVLVAENEAAADDTVHCSEPSVLIGKDEPIAIDDQPHTATESALEQLANNPEAISKYSDMPNDVKEMDMIAFKVFTPNFEQSNYIIGLVEAIVGRTTADQQEYDLVLQIMGKDLICFPIFFTFFSQYLMEFVVVVSFFSWTQSHRTFASSNTKW